ncbi:DUF3579 domain-containing protein [Coxiella endosymbiont of Amblyomma nuttalli]|uniref:DUF3579 domain-containing protein n=1 Tax=Coxiella endosymbiont of Amblyomma nuttalli TaxID=2749996 RepID=UPI001FD0BFCF|nr:DUF3579 domain-containing protein [Coxiella endosymbiont of Amblyomma nuttalli]
MSGTLFTFHKHQIYYSSLLYLFIKEGHKCVVLNPHFEQSNPELHESIIIKFVITNNLLIYQEYID